MEKTIFSKPKAITKKGSNTNEPLQKKLLVDTEPKLNEQQDKNQIYVNNNLILLNDDRKTGVVWHKDMIKHAPVGWPKNEHCECPSRLESIIKTISKCSSMKEKDVELVSEYPEADEKFVNEGHNRNSYYDYIRKVFDPRENQSYTDTYSNEHTTRAALLAAQAVKIAVDKIYEENVWKNAFCAIRPPGHHADATGHGGFGFCFINNVVCGVRYAQKKYQVKKICIFDWDVHHGDSTQNLTEDDPSILFISFHRYDNGKMFPGKSGSQSNSGGVYARGFNLNLPWNVNWERDHKVVGNEEYIFAFERLVAPILKEWKPELTFISAGFDSCDGDKLGGIAVKPSCYSYLTDRLSRLTIKNRVIVALEGGYNLKSISQSSECVFRTLRGEKDPVASVETGNNLTYDQLLLNAIPTKTNFRRIERVQKEWEKFWPCIKNENISQDLKETMNRAKRFSALRDKIVGPNLNRFGHQDLDSGKDNLQDNYFIKNVKESERDFYNLLLSSNELKSLKPLFPEITQANDFTIKMVNFMQKDSDFENATLLKVDLFPYTIKKSSIKNCCNKLLCGCLDSKNSKTLGKNLQFSFVETNIKDSSTGEAQKFLPMADNKIWQDAIDDKRVVAGIQQFFQKDYSVNKVQLCQQVNIISKELHKTIEVIDKLLTTEKDFVKKNLHLSELSIVLMLNHEDKKGSVKQIAPKLVKNRGKVVAITSALKNLTEFIDGLA